MRLGLKVSRKRVCLIILLAGVAGDPDNLSALRAEGGRKGARLPADAEDISVFIVRYPAIDCRLVARSQGDFRRAVKGILDSDFWRAL